jgi:stage II sporulation protein D
VLLAATGLAPSGQIDASSIVISTQPGQLVGVGDYLFNGPLIISRGPGGLAVTETLRTEDYLLGIREVPFSWPDEALKTQAVAARTYLAYTLAQGRTSNGRAYGYDICATTACQVYAGVRGLQSLEGQRWQAAVAATAGEILVYDGRPIQALYSSTAGARTRESEDIFPGLDAPYLAAVDSPGEDSPFVNWSFSISERDLETLLAAEGNLSGPLRSISVVTTADGEGPWQVVVDSGTASASYGTYQFRSEINRAAAAVMPDRFPAERPDGRRYPQTVLSGTYEISERSIAIEHDGYRELAREFVFSGQGWGHQVGMSQFGAKALADAGSTYPEILAHYYGGLTPVPAGGWLPEQITVGLTIGVEELTVLAPDGATVTADGVELANGVAVWRFGIGAEGVETSIPAGIGLAPEIRPRLPYRLDGYHLAFHLTAPAVVTVSGTINGQPLEPFELGLIEAGFYDYRLGEVFSDVAPADLSQGLLRLSLVGASPYGDAAASLVRVPERR